MGRAAREPSRSLDAEERLQWVMIGASLVFLCFLAVLPIAAERSEPEHQARARVEVCLGGPECPKQDVAQRTDERSLKLELVTSRQEDRFGR
jgi:hypothetical protein